MKDIKILIRETLLAFLRFIVGAVILAIAIPPVVIVVKQLFNEVVLFWKMF